MDGGHSPFLARPADLTTLLEGLLIKPDEVR
jgi:hypothetical protein